MNDTVFGAYASHPWLPHQDEQMFGSGAVLMDL
jgi:hypothetical protein